MPLWQTHVPLRWGRAHTCRHVDANPQVRVSELEAHNAQLQEHAVQLERENAALEAQLRLLHAGGSGAGSPAQAAQLAQVRSRAL